MASESSAKKVARVAARSGGGAKSTKQRNWIFPAAIIAVVVLGVGVVAFARNENSGAADNDTAPRAQLAAGQPADHWHAAFAVSVCGKEQAPLTDGATDPLGIHTHDDGLIHIHPFSLRAAGDNATLGRFFDQVGIEVTDGGMKLQDGKVYKEGETECGGKEAELVLAHWEDARTAGSSEPDDVITDDIASFRFEEDLGAITLAFEPKGAKEYPVPAAAAQIEELGALDGGAAPTGGQGDPGTAPAAPEGSEPESTEPQTTESTEAPSTTTGGE